MEIFLVSVRRLARAFAIKTKLEYTILGWQLAEEQGFIDGQGAE
jgi:hypothetical protein